MANAMYVEFVAADRRLWSGEATMVNVRTLAGEIGVLANHAPVLSVLDEGQVDIRTVDDGQWVAAVDGGFISVANNRVSILCDRVEVAEDGNYEEAKGRLDEVIERAEQARERAREDSDSD